MSLFMSTGVIAQVYGGGSPPIPVCIVKPFPDVMRFNALGQITTGITQCSISASSECSNTTYSVTIDYGTGSGGWLSVSPTTLNSSGIMTFDVTCSSATLPNTVRYAHVRILGNVGGLGILNVYQSQSGDVGGEPTNPGDFDTGEF